MMMEKVYDILRGYGLEALLISSPYNMRYISGFTGGTGMLYISLSNKAVITDSRYTNQALLECKNSNFEVIEITKGDYISEINKLIEKDNVESLGFEAEHVLVSRFIKFNNGLKCNHLVNVESKVDELRQVKTPEEIENLKHAEAISDIAFSKILDVIKPGITEIEVGATLEYYMKMEGAEGLSFDTIVASGIHSSMPHAGVSNKKIEYGDFVTMDFGCIYNGYCSDMTRTVVVGKADEEQKKVYDIVLKAQLAALDYIRAGRKCSDVDKVARDIISNEGYGHCFGHGLGHSVGLFIHEEPRLSYTSDSILKAGMSQTVEPGIYIKDKFGVRIEDMVIITEDGYINTSHSPKNLIEL